MFRLLLLAVVVRLGSSLTVQGCPFGLQRNEYLQVFGDSCYRFEVTDSADYTNAKSACEDVTGGHLVVVKSKDVNDFLTQQLRNTYSITSFTWIGLNDREEENKFVWDDGTVLNQTVYSNFGKKEGPRKSFVQSDWEDCVVIDPRSGKWRDYHCDTELFGIYNVEKHYICEYPPRNSSMVRRAKDGYQCNLCECGKPRPCCPC